ncbi:modification methylase, HemK family [Neorickettsia sennetsu str. Miyayama]|uniref:Modification methylase, HemK family n=2 Tax=Ehrlichia sennetsu TaxID=951 RepID=Q2GER8_EHRS3|nr:modification methylase, HemK family [Neorickettsia sennetsu str. Miyayama]
MPQMKEKDYDSDMSIRARLIAGSRYLANWSSTPHLDAELLLAHVLSLNREQLILYCNEGMTDSQAMDFEMLLKLRKSHSVAAIVGEKEFWKHSFAVNKDVLIPRPDTETMLVALLSRYKKLTQPLKIVELGTGSGCVIISILKEFRNALGFGFEKSRAAFYLTMHNMLKYGLRARLKLYRLGFESAMRVLSCKVDVIVSNPPYVRRGEIPYLQLEVQNEPRIALDGGFNGILPYFSILKLASKILRPGGEIFLEIGSSWRDSVVSANYPFKIVERYRDLSGIERILVLK